MSSQLAENNINGTPSVSRDASRLDIPTPTYPPASPHRQDLGIPKDVEKQWDAAGDDLEQADVLEDEKCQSTIEEDVSDSSTEVVVTGRPRLGLRQNTVQSIAAAPYANTWVPEDLEKHVPAQNGTRPRSPSTASTVPPDLPPAPSASRVSTDAFGNTYPEGGLTAWLCVFGSFTGLMAALGMMNTIGTYQAYLTSNVLTNVSTGSVGWIFGMYSFLSFFLGIQIGPIFDAYGPRLLVFAGSIFLTAAQLFLAQSTQYWHFMLSFGVLGGTGTSLIFTPAISAIGHHFLHKRGQTVGLAAVGGSLGGIVFPLTLQSLIPRIGFAWSCRLVALLNLILLLLANLFIRSRLPRKSKISLQDILPDFLIFRDLTFAFTTAGVFFTEWALFVPLSYISSYCLAHGISSHLSYQMLAVLNTGSCLGRYFPGLIADRIGRFNSIIITIAGCAILTLALWLPANGSLPILIVFLIFFGFASGSGISLTPVCIGQLCKTENLGRYYATCYTVASFATLTGIPIAGSIIASGSNGWMGLILFTGLTYTIALASFTAARVRGVGWEIRKRY